MNAGPTLPSPDSAKRLDESRSTVSRRDYMSCCILVALVLSLLAVAMDLAGIWKGGGDLAAVLFGSALVLALLSIVKDSDKILR